MTHFWCYDLSCMSSLHFPLEILLIAFLLVPRMKFTMYVMRIHCFVFIILVVPISLVFLCLAFSLSLEGRNQFFDVKGSSCLEMFILCSPKRERKGRVCWGGTCGQNSWRLQAGLLSAVLKDKRTRDSHPILWKKP